jgi:malto-oligosyltrehalose trehalohydrolase
MSVAGTPAGVRRRHAMPFGAAPLAAGGVRFALWAPAPRAVDLVLGDGRVLPMPRDAAAWARLDVAGAGPGTRYRFRVDGGLHVPDPAARFQPGGVHGESEVIDPEAYPWRDDGWGGVPAEALAFYELHVGTFTPAGTFRATAERLPYLRELGVTALELMPVATFPGARGWGYDGVLLFAPHPAYGRPEDLKALVDAAHAEGIAVMLDVVYNHLGPEGNYLGAYAPALIASGRDTPWGAGLDFDGAGAPVARRLVVDNALYWLEEYHLDGLRLDAVHAIHDASARHVLDEVAAAVAEGPGRRRHVHLVLENDDNDRRWLEPRGGRPPAYRAQWNDDFHHAAHVLLTGERSGYYADYVPPAPLLARCLAEGFGYQGQRSARRGRPRGTPSGTLPVTAFVQFLQNHDHVGNRALGERLDALAPEAGVRAAAAVLLLSPALPLLFMGEEWAAPEPFLYFSDLGPDLGPSVTEGRRREFAAFAGFGEGDASRIPDPQDPATARRSTLDWTRIGELAHRARLDLYRTLLALRRREIVPLVAADPRPHARAKAIDTGAVEAQWTFARRSTLSLVANLGAAPVAHAGPGADWGRRLHATGLDAPSWDVLPPWSAAVYLSLPGA